MRWLILVCAMGLVGCEQCLQSANESFTIHFDHTTSPQYIEVNNCVDSRLKISVDKPMTMTDLEQKKVIVLKETEKTNLVDWCLFYKGDKKGAIVRLKTGSWSSDFAFVDLSTFLTLQRTIGEDNIFTNAMENNGVDLGPKHVKADIEVVVANGECVVTEIGHRRGLLYRREATNQWDMLAFDKMDLDGNTIVMVDGHPLIDIDHLRRMRILVTDDGKYKWMKLDRIFLNASQMRVAEEEITLK